MLVFISELSETLGHPVCVVSSFKLEVNQVTTDGQQTSTSSKSKSPHNFSSSLKSLSISPVCHTITSSHDFLTYLCVPSRTGGWRLRGLGGGKTVRKVTETGDKREEKASTLTARLDGSERLHQEFNHEQN